VRKRNHAEINDLTLQFKVIILVNEKELTHIMNIYLYTLCTVYLMFAPTYDL